MPRKEHIMSLSHAVQRRYQLSIIFRRGENLKRLKAALPSARTTIRQGRRPSVRPPTAWHVFVRQLPPASLSMPAVRALQPNTDLLHPRAVVPGLLKSLDKGTHVLTCVVATVEAPWDLTVACLNMSLIASSYLLSHSKYAPGAQPRKRRQSCSVGSPKERAHSHDNRTAIA